LKAAIGRTLATAFEYLMQLKARGALQLCSHYASSYCLYVNDIQRWLERLGRLASARLALLFII
jgi:hypothetical protein